MLAVSGTAQKWYRRRIEAAVAEIAEVSDGPIGLASPAGLVKAGGHRNRRGQMVGGKTKVNEDAIYDLDLMMHDPLKYIEAASKRMDAKGIHGSEAQITALMKASQRSTIAGIFADLLKDYPQILKEQQNIQNTRPDMAEHMAAVDPAAKVQQFEAALTNLATELGSAGMGDAMGVLDRLTAGLNALADWAHNNPGLARVAFDVAAGLGAVATALGTLSTAILVFGPALRLLGIGGGSSEAAAAAAGIGALGLGAAAAGAAAIGGSLYLGGTTDPHKAEQQLNDLSRQRRQDPMMSPPTGDGYGVDGLPLAKKSSWIVPVPPTPPVHITSILNVDGQEMTRVVQYYQDREYRKPDSGASTADGRYAILYQNLYSTGKLST